MQPEQQLPFLPPQIAALLPPQMVQLNLQAREKLPALRELARVLKGHAHLSRPEAFFREVLAREQVHNTGLGHGVAMPHARSELCSDFVLAVGRSIVGLDYGAPDGEPVHLLFLIGAPLQHATPYHRLVVGLARLLEPAANRRHLLKANTPAEFLHVLAHLRAGRRSI
jgi:mannitol/fructose-specific phosphotransferase system IIA component (Ntr-type)